MFLSALADMKSEPTKGTTAHNPPKHIYTRSPIACLYLYRMDASTLLSIHADGEHAFAAVPQHEQDMPARDARQAFDRYFPSASGDESSDNRARRDVLVVDGSVENSASSDYTVRVHYDGVPSVPALLAQSVWAACCASAADNARTTEFVYQAVYRSVSQFACVGPTDSFPSVRRFCLLARAASNRPAQSVQQWADNVLPTLTAFKSVQPAPDLHVADIDLRLPCHVVFITTNAYGFVFFDRIQRQLLATEPHRTASVRMIGALVVPGAGNGLAF